jgi:NTE family protein
VKEKRKTRIALALGSGGARGWAHLGVLRALRERGIEVAAVAGTSMGALVGVFLAAGRLDALESVASTLDWRQLARFLGEFTPSRSGLTEGHRLLKEAAPLLRAQTFAELALPYRAVATDLESGTEVILSDGPLLPAVRASISIPGLFTPVHVNGRWLVDGGLVNPVPVNVARALAPELPVVAIDVTQGIPDGTAPLAKAPPLGDVLTRTIRIAESRLAAYRRAEDPPDLLVEVPVASIATLDFLRAPEAAALGHAATLAALDAAGW